MENNSRSKQKGDNKLSYPDLENVCHQLSAQAQQLNAQNEKLRKYINEINLENLYKRLDYLFKVICEDNIYLSAGFKKQCAEEIEKLMTPPVEEDNKESE